jgi:hypothetical protein
MSLCRFLSEPRCTRPATHCWPPGVEANICSTHFRHETSGQFGEKTKPPFSRDRARKSLIEEDGLAPDVAEKLLNDHFGPEPK